MTHDIAAPHLHMRDQHERFDLAMELLCILPGPPRAAVQEDVLSDLGIKQTQLMVLCRSLESRHGITVMRANAGGCRKISVSPNCGHKARIAAEHYWDTVYGARKP